MVKLPQVKSKQIERALLQLGFVARSGKGSHKVFKHEDGRRTVLPVHSRAVSIGTLRAILKQVDLSPNDFLEMI